MRKRQFTALGGWLLLFLLLCAVAVSGMAPQVWGGVVLLLVLPVGTWGMNFLLKEKLEAELKMPSTAEKGKEIQAEVTIQNHARIPAVHLFCTVQAENRLTGRTPYWSWSCLYRQEEVAKVSSRFAGHTVAIFIQRSAK